MRDITQSFANDFSDITELQEVKDLKLRVRRCLESGSQLSTNQARRAFAQYLQQVLARLGPSVADSPNTPSELCLRFLQRASANLRAPFFVKVDWKLCVVMYGTDG